MVVVGVVVVVRTLLLTSSSVSDSDGTVVDGVCDGDARLTLMGVVGIMMVKDCWPAE